MVACLNEALPQFHPYSAIAAIDDQKTLHPAIADFYIHLLRLLVGFVREIVNINADTDFTEFWSFTRQDCDASLDLLNSAVTTSSRRLDRVAFYLYIGLSQDIKNQIQENDDEFNVVQAAFDLDESHLAPDEEKRKATVPKVNNAPVRLLTEHFTGRAKELERMIALLRLEPNGEPAVCIITGIEGIGKTQLALKYCASAYDGFSNLNVLWLPATTLDKLQESLVSNTQFLYEKIHRQENYRPVTQNFKALLESLEADETKHWLIVIDDIDLSVVELLAKSIPLSSSRIQLLFTTRSDDASKMLATNFRAPLNTIQLHHPSLDESTNIFKSVSGYQTSKLAEADHGVLSTILQAVGCLPLAVTQIAAYIGRSPGAELRDVLKELTRRGGSEVSILNTCETDVTDLKGL